MDVGDAIGMTSGYPYPKVFQKGQKNQKGIAKTKRSVISKGKARRPIVKKTGK